MKVTITKTTMGVTSVTVDGQQTITFTEREIDDIALILAMIRKSRGFEFEGKVGGKIIPATRGG